MSTDPISPQYTHAVTCWSRPKRIAFLVNPEVLTDEEFNEILKFNFEAWGGRYNPIIPTDGKEINSDWWKFLEMHDPDYIYSLIELEEQLIRKINRKILPAKIIEPDEISSVDGRFIIRPHEVDTLGIDNIPRYAWISRGSIGEPFFIYIKDSVQTGPDKNFMLRNFGAFVETIFMERTYRDVPSETLDLSQFAVGGYMNRLLSERKNYVFPIDLCRMYTQPSYYLENDSFIEGFHVIVGDHPLDLLFSWNRASFTVTPRGLPWGRDTLWISKDLCGDETFLELIGQWIRCSFWPNKHNVHCKVISYSVDDDTLGALAEKFTAFTHLSSLYFHSRKLSLHEFPCPNFTSLRPTTDHHTELVSFSENKGLIRFPAPPFLTESKAQNGWMVDFEIQYCPDRYAAYTNIRPNWQLPKRLGISDLFFYRDPIAHVTRVIRDGLLSTAVQGTDATVGIRIPSDMNVIWSFFDRRYDNTTKHRLSKTSRFVDFRISDKGRYLRGIIQLFGNLFWAGCIIDDPYWRAILGEMAGKPGDLTELRTQRAKKALEEFLGESSGPLTRTHPDLVILAKRLGERLTLRDVETKELTKNNLKTRFGNLRSEALQAKQDRQYWQANERYDSDKDSTLEYLVENQVLLQGAKISCPQCQTSQWNIVDNLQSGMQCVGCLSKFSLPLEPQWSFKLNTLVTNALRKHGTLPVLQTLNRLDQELVGRMFLYLPCQDIFEGRSDRPHLPRNDSFTDLDLIGIRAGSFFIGEVKSDPKSFKDSDLQKLKAAAEDLIPDEIVLAAPGERWPPDIEEMFSKLSQDLEPIDIKIHRLLL